MKLLQLKIENFTGLLGEHELMLDGLGLVHVAGINKDDPGNNSNGSGKSSVLEALTWALFGEGLPRPQGNSEQGIRADEVLNDTLGKQCYVRVDVQDDNGIGYSVERWRKHKWGGAKRQSNGQRLVTEGEDALGCRSTEALDEKETNRLICKALGISHDIWCRGVVFGQESQFNFCDATAKQRTEILTTVMGLEVIDTWHERCRDEKRALTNKLAEASGRLEVLKAQEKQAWDEWNNAPEIVAAWDAQQIERVRNVESRQQDIEDRGKALRTQVDALGPLREPLQSRDWPEIAAGAAEYATRATAQAELRHLQSRQATNANEHDRIRQLTGNCPTCLQPIAETHQGACMAELERQAVEIQAQIQAAQELYKATGEAVQRVDAERAKARDERQRHQAEVAKDQQACRLAVQQRSQLEQELAAARATWQALGQQMAALKAEVNPNLAYAADSESKLKTAQMHTADAEHEHARIAGSLEICLWWDKELPRFRTWLFDSIVDALAAETNRWLRIMSGGILWVQISTTKLVQKRLKDELDVQIHRWNQDGTTTCRPYRTWSGGEKRRVALAVDLGLSRMLATRAAKAYRFLCLDEIDRHLDDRGKDGLRQVLEDLRSEKDTCLVITHDPQFRASFDNEVTVTRQGGQVRMETCNVNCRQN